MNFKGQNSVCTFTFISDWFYVCFLQKELETTCVSCLYLDGFSEGRGRPVRGLNIQFSEPLGPGEVDERTRHGAWLLGPVPPRNAPFLRVHCGCSDQTCGGGWTGRTQEVGQASHKHPCIPMVKGESQYHSLNRWSNGNSGPLLFSA